jgi:LPS export ABC transporter protein LptC
MPRTEAVAAPGARRLPRPLAAIAAALTSGALAAILASCSLDYSGASLEEGLPERLPDTVATDLVHRVVRNSRTSLEVTADQAETWNAQRRMELAGAAFVEYDQHGAPAVQGTAGRVVFHTDTEDAEISGGVRVHSSTEEAGIATGSLSWKRKERQLSAPPHELVVITKDDGSRLEGTGFTGDFRRREFAFSGPVHGTYVWNKEKEAE